MKPLLACVFLAVVVYGVCKKLGIGKADRFVLDHLRALTHDYAQRCVDEQRGSSDVIR